jgi:hypothetical protein
VVNTEETPSISIVIGQVIPAGVGWVEEDRSVPQMRPEKSMNRPVLRQPSPPQLSPSSWSQGHLLLQESQNYIL